LENERHANIVYSRNNQSPIFNIGFIVMQMRKPMEIPTKIAQQQKIPEIL